MFRHKQGIEFSYLFSTRHPLATFEESTYCCLLVLRANPGCCVTKVNVNKIINYSKMADSPIYSQNILGSKRGEKV